jgi:amino acid transporter
MLSSDMEENRRDAGLVRAVGPWSLAAGVVNIVVGAGIFAVPGALAESLGVYAPLAFLVCAAAIGAVAVCFAEAGSRIPTSGGVYGCIEAAFGPFTAYVAGTLLWFGNVLACGGVAAALADVVASVLPPTYQRPARVAAVVCVIGGLGLVNFGGVARGAKFVNAATLVKLIPIAIFVVVGAGAMHGTNFTALAGSSVHSTAAGLDRALILAMFTFVGMETALCASGEVVQPARSIPRALAISLIFIALLYVAIQFIAQGILGDSLAHSSVPLADAMARISPILRAVMLVGAAISMFGWLGSDILCSPRILFALARDGVLPRVLGRVHARFQSPHFAIAFYCMLAVGLALSGTFAELAVLSTLAIAPLYVAGCASAWRLAHRRVALAGEPLNFRWLSIAVVCGITSMLVLIGLASRAEIMGLVVIIIVSSLVYLLQSRLRPAMRESTG